MRRVIFSVNAAMQRGSNAAPISHQQDGWMRDNGATPTRARMQRGSEREREKGEGEGEEERERERERDVQSIMHARTHAPEWSHTLPLAGSIRPSENAPMYFDERQLR